MTKKHFRAMADALADCRPAVDSPDRAQWLACMLAVAQVFEQAYPKFDRERFEGWAEGCPQEWREPR